MGVGELVAGGVIGAFLVWAFGQKALAKKAKQIEQRVATEVKKRLEKATSTSYVIDLDF